MKKILIVSLCIMLLASMVGCGNQSQDNTQEAAKNGVQEAEKNEAQEPAKDTTATDSKSTPIEIDFWYSLGGKNGEVIAGMVEEFNKSQKEVVVNATFQGNYYENHAKVLSALVSGTQPDVTMIEIASIGTFAKEGVIEDLGPYVDGDGNLDINEYIPGLMGNSYWNNTLYAIPFNRSTPLLYVNKTMLEEAGLDPAGPKTWDELEEYARTLTKGEEVYGFSTPIDIWFYEALVFENGGQILTEDGQPVFNNEKGLAPVELWKNMIDEGIMKMPPGEKYNAWDVAFQDFVSNKVGMIFTSTGSLNGVMEQAQGFEVGTAFLPAKEDFGVPTGGTNLAVLSKSSQEEKEAAWKFIKYMTDVKQTIHWSKSTGYMPVKVAAVESDEMKALYEEKPQFKVAIDQLQYAYPRPMVPGYKEVQEIIMTELQRAIIDDNVTTKEAMDKAAEKAKEILQ